MYEKQMEEYIAELHLPEPDYLQMVNNEIPLQELLKKNPRKVSAENTWPLSFGLVNSVWYKNIDAYEEYKKKLEGLGIDDTYLRSQQEQDLTIQKYKENFDKNLKISDEEMKKYYEEHKADYYKDEVKASHILISTVDDNGKELSEAKKKEAKKKAEEVLKKAKSGEEFSELAKEYSDDSGSAANGGDLGYFTKGQMVQPFEEAAFSLKSGEISGLVESEYGYHIIKVYDKIDKQLTFDEVKDEIKKTLTEDKYMESIEAITKKAKVEKNESVIKKVKF